MLNSSILDVVIGLVFCFAGVALFVSSINEAIAALLKSRHRELFKGIKWLLNNSPYVGSLYNHALINPLLVRDNPVPLPANLGYGAISRHPAYIPSANFARALTDVIGNVPQDFAALQEAVNNIPDQQLREALQGFLVRANGDIGRFESQVADWFDSAMDRLSGVYKRRTQLVTFLIGAGVAALFNINACHVLSALWQRPSLASAITSPNSTAIINSARELAYSQAKASTGEAAPTQNAGIASPLAKPGEDTKPVQAAGHRTDAAGQQNQKATVATPAVQGSGTLNPGTNSAPGEALQLQKGVLGVLGTLPIGWSSEYFRHLFSGEQVVDVDGKPRSLFWDWASFLAGIVITASAAVFGAPFWFDMLQRLIQVRSTGTKPLTQREREEAAYVPKRTP
jgi:hypothetical protein